MITSQLMALAAMTIPIFLGSCSTASTERQPNSDTPPVDNGGQLETTAARPKAAESVSVLASTVPTVAAVPSAGNDTADVVRVPEDVLQHPAELMTLMQQIRAQIVFKTKKIPETEYEQLIRPSLAKQLRAAGFADKDVDDILSDVDYSRSLQGIR